MKPELDKWYLLENENKIRRVIKIIYKGDGTDYFEGNIYSEDGKEVHRVPITPKSFKNQLVKELTEEEVFGFID